MKKQTITIIWPNNISIAAYEGDDWFLIAAQVGYEIPTGCLTGSCGACEIDVNGKTARPCITQIKSKKKCTLVVNLTNDPFW